MKIIICVLTLMIGMIQICLAQDGVAMIVFAKGAVNIINAEGTARQATPKELLKATEKISTGKDSMTIIRLMDKSTLKIEQESLLEIVELIASYKTGIMGSSNFILSSGRALVDVVKKYSGPPALEIKTNSNISFGVRGTNFLIDIDTNTKTVWCTVGSGIVEAFDYEKDDSEVIEKGNSMAVTQGKILTRPIKFQWADKINWNTDPQKGDLVSIPAQIVEERQVEEKNEEKNILKRAPRPFKKALEEQRKIFGKKYRDELATQADQVVPTSEPAQEKTTNPIPLAKNLSKEDIIKKAKSNEFNAKKACEKMAKAFNCQATREECPQGFFPARKLGIWKVCVKKKFIQ